jgi:glutamine synthetase adenylyltransferase
MKYPFWAKAIETCADPQRATHFLELLATRSAGPRLAEFSDEQIRVLVSLFSGSQALSNALVAKPAQLEALDPERIRHPRRAQGFRAELEGILKPLFDAGRLPRCAGSSRRRCYASPCATWHA